MDTLGEFYAADDSSGGAFRFVERPRRGTYRVVEVERVGRPREMTPDTAHPYRETLSQPTKQAPREVSWLRRIFTGSDGYDYALVVKEASGYSQILGPYTRRAAHRAAKNYLSSDRTLFVCRLPLGMAWPPPHSWALLSGRAS